MSRLLEPKIGNLVVLESKEDKEPRHFVWSLLKHTESQLAKILLEENGFSWLSMSKFVSLNGLELPSFLVEALKPTLERNLNEANNTRLRTKYVEFLFTAMNYPKLSRN